MIRNLLILPDGTEISSGSGTTNAIKSTTLISCVNDGSEMSIGSTCPSELRVDLLSPDGTLSLAAGAEVTLYRVDSAGVRTKKGVFILAKPTRPTPNTMKLTGYDRVTKLDKDLTTWLNGVTGWPYAFNTFAAMVCEACGVTFKETDVPNSDFLIYQFTRAGVTGRKIMKWLGEICCRFCRANADGEIEFAWYTPSGVTIAPTGDRYYFQRALTYETYQVSPVEAVQIRLADSSDGALWPTIDSGLNSYIIEDNAIINARVTEDMTAYLEVIAQQLASVTYTPCKLSIPACQDIEVGNTVSIVDKNGDQITAYVMMKTTTGQRDTLECTGSRRRDSSEALNNQKPSVSQQVQVAFAGLTQAQIFNKLTDNGKIQGIYALDGKWHVNAEVAKIINLTANDITAGKLISVDGKSYFDLDAGKIVTNNIVATGGMIGKWNINSNKMYAGDGVDILTAVVAAPRADNTYVFAAGGKSHNNYGDCPFRVTKTGKLYATDAEITGKVTAESGDIGGWTIATNGLYRVASDGQIRLIPAGNLSQNYTVNGYSTKAWVMLCGPDNTTTANFGVTTAGKLYAKDANLSGTINATGGKIGNWTVSSDGYLEGTGGANTIRLYPKGVAYSGYTFYLVVYDSGGAVPVGGITASGWKSL